MSRRVIQLTAVLLLGVVINAGVFFGQDRFRAPVDPPLMVVLVVGIVRAIGALGQKHNHPQPDATSSQR